MDLNFPLDYTFYHLILKEVFDSILSLFAGFMCGVVFSLLHLPIPAPVVFAGIVGILGIYLGYYFVNLF